MPRKYELQFSLGVKPVFLKRGPGISFRYITLKFVETLNLFFLLNIFVLGVLSFPPMWSVNKLIMRRKLNCLIETR